MKTFFKKLFHRCNMKKKYGLDIPVRPWLYQPRTPVGEWQAERCRGCETCGQLWEFLPECCSRDGKYPAEWIKVN